MSYALSTKDIRFLQKMCILTNCFLITPWYDFKTRSIFWNKFSKISAFFMSFGRLIGFLLVFQSKEHEVFMKKILFTQKLLFLVLSSQAIIQGFFQSVGSTFLFTSKWQNLLQNLEYIDIKLKNQGKKERQILKNFYFWFVLQHLVFLMSFTPYMYFWINFVTDNIEKYAIFGAIEIYNQFLLSVLLHTLVKCFLVRYHHLNKKLIDACTKSANFERQLLEIKKLFRILSESVDIFNCIFGYHILIIIIHGGLHILNCANFTFVEVAIGEQHLQKQAAVSVTSLAAFLGVTVLMIVFPCDETVKEAERFVTLCYSLQEKFQSNSTESKQLMMAGEQCRNFIRHFYAAGFIRVDKRAIFGLLGTVTTYFIVIVQFNASEYQNGANRTST